jgi:hypothetical protein
MKQFFLRLLSAHPLALLAALCLLPPASVYLWREAFRVGVAEREIVQAKNELLQRFDQHAGILEKQVSRVVDGDPRAIMPEDRKPLRALLLAEIHGDFQQLSDGTFREIRGFRTAADARFGDTLQTANRALGVVETLQTSVKPALDGLAKTEARFGALADSYGALPDRLAFELRPAWLSLQPEITCRQLDGSGYGGCWHSRVTALMGEAARVGGAFTQKFPALSESITGIAEDFHGITANVRGKYFTPEPPAKTFGEKIKRFLKRAWEFASGLALALARGGAF